MRADFRETYGARGSRHVDRRSLDAGRLLAVGIVVKIGGYRQAEKRPTISSAQLTRDRMAAGYLHAMCDTPALLHTDKKRLSGSGCPDGTLGVRADAERTHPFKIRLSLLWSRLENVTLQRCDLRGLEAQDVVFEGCDLSGSDLSESRLRRVEFRSCRLSGTTLSRSTLTDVRWTDCKLDRVNLRMAEGDCVWVLDSNMHEADLYAATFRSSRFLRSDLSACEFSQVDLHGARLQGSRLDGAKGAAGLKGVEVDPDQAVVLAQLLLELHEISVRDDPER